MRIYLIILLLMVPIALAIEECKPVTIPSEIPCQVTSTWNYTPPCLMHKMLVFNSSGKNIHNFTFSTYGMSGLCNVTWNISEPGSYAYTLNTTADTGNIIVEAQDNMGSLTVGLFLMGIVTALFLLPFIVRFTEREVTNQIIKKIMWILAFAILAFVTTIMTTIADNAGLNITKDMLLFVWFFHKSLFIFMILLFFNIITSTPKLWKQEKMRRRMGENEG